VDCSFDVWYRFKEERDEILEMVANVTANALFLSGDTHYPGIFRLGENMLEISASPLGAFGNLPRLVYHLSLDNVDRHGRSSKLHSLSVAFQ